MPTYSSISSFTDLIVWQKGHELVILIYKETNSFPQSEQFGLVSQLRRASVSVTSNIAEGFGRISFKEKARMYYIAEGSLSEIKNQLLIAKDLNYLSDNSYKVLNDLTNSTHKLLRLLNKANKARISNS